MKIHSITLLLVLSLTASSCALMNHSTQQRSSSLVGFLYPGKEEPPHENSIPELHVPLRVGLAFLPSQYESAATTIDAVQREALMNRIRLRFADRKFVSEIKIIPDYYLRGAASEHRGIEGLKGLQRLYNVDVIALISYDQITHLDDNRWSLGYLTIVGAYILKGNRHEIATLVDLAVIDPVTHSLILRAGGMDARHGNSTLIDKDRELRADINAAFTAATEQMIEHFDIALQQFETDVRAGKASVRVTTRSGARIAGGGAFGFVWVSSLLILLMIMRRRAIKQSQQYCGENSL